jgi:hypothetical protein
MHPENSWPKWDSYMRPQAYKQISNSLDHWVSEVAQVFIGKLVCEPSS